MNQGRGKVYGLSFPTRKTKNEIKVSLNDVFNEESDKEENYKELVGVSSFIDEKFSETSRLFSNDLHSSE